MRTETRTRTTEPFRIGEHDVFKTTTTKGDTWVQTTIHRAEGGPSSPESFDDQPAIHTRTRDLRIWEWKAPTGRYCGWHRQGRPAYISVQLDDEGRGNRLYAEWWLNDEMRNPEGPFEVSLGADLQVLTTHYNSDTDIPRWKNEYIQEVLNKDSHLFAEYFTPGKPLEITF